MFELDVFPALLENDLLKVDKILGLFFFRQEKTLKDSKPQNLFFFIYRSWIFCSMQRLQLPFIRGEEAVFLSPECFLSNK